MSTFLVFTVVFACASTSPIIPGAAQDATTWQPDLLQESLQRDLTAVSYVQEFKNAMTDYVRSQYKNLTTNEVEAVQMTVEDFLINFGKDLRDVLEAQSATAAGENTEEPAAKIEERTQAIEDGLSDTQFEDIKKRIKEQFSQISEGSAQEIVYRLRRNLLATRQKLDEIIRNSKKAHEMYSQAF